MKTRFRNRQRVSLNRKSLATAVLVLCALLVKVMGPGPLEGRLPGFEYRVAVQIDSSKVRTESDLFDFPLYLDIELQELKLAKKGGKLQHEKGYDIRFTASDGATPFMHEIISYDPKRGKLQAWVNIDTLKAGDFNFVYLYFGAFIPVTQQNLFLGERHIDGYFYNKDKIQSVAVTENYSDNWMALEVLNQKSPHLFSQTGEIEEVDSPLPDVLQYFNTELKGGTIMMVEWGTSMEYDNDYFELEKSLDAKTYTHITRMGGGDQSHKLLRYSHADHKLVESGVYYRLKQVNNNGDYSYSDPVFATIEKNDFGIKIESISPNPFIESFEVIYQSSRPDNISMQLFDEAGNILQEEMLHAKIGRNTFSFTDENNQLPKGGYVFTLMGSDNKLQVAQISKIEPELSHR